MITDLKRPICMPTIFLNGFNTDHKELIDLNTFWEEKLPNQVQCIEWIAHELPGVLIDYIETRSHASKAAIDLAMMLIAKQGPVNVICHSMGNLVFFEAMQHVRKFIKLKLGHVFLIAPDIDSDAMESDAGLAILTSARSVTVFYNPADEALEASCVMNFHNRLGHKGCANIEGHLEAIDCESFAKDYDVLGHSYFQDGRKDGAQSPVIDKIKMVIQHKQLVPLGQP